MTLSLKEKAAYVKVHEAGNLRIFSILGVYAPYAEQPLKILVTVADGLICPTGIAPTADGAQNLTAALPAIQPQPKHM